MFGKGVGSKRESENDFCPPRAGFFFADRIGLVFMCKETGCEKTDTKDTAPLFTAAPAHSG